ncbi:MAG: BBP7 family outer membrane beta-barrel protein [Fuerstiella sp.]|nr:BBP7 family outer membrane beta-barrel protein [Fuerstiella sp.]MCP4858928.1 BBP7 family outer membrane beta-barrel protein [Fuerstiella sp.]
MFRSNLFRCFSLICVTLVGSDAFAQHPHGYGQMPGIHVPQSSYQAPILDYYVGQKPPLWDDQQPIEKFVTALGKRSWFRVDYLHMDFQRPGNLAIGAPLLNITDPLTVADELAGGAPTGVGIIPNLNGIDLSDNSGIRGTWGLDLQGAEFELEFFGTEQKTDTITMANLQAFRDPLFPAIGTTARPNVVVPLLTTGAPADAASANYLIYDQSYAAELKAKMWGAEAILVRDSYVPGEGLSWQWLGGFRYMAFEEQFSQLGLFNNGGGVAPATRISQIRSTTANHMYGPEVGARASIVHRKFTFSMTPRIAFTLNDHTAKTQSGPLVGTAVSATDPLRTFDESHIEFTPLFELSFTGELHLTPNFSIFGGYDFMWMYKVTRPFDNIHYNSVPGAAGSFNPIVSQQVNLDTFYTKGLSFGCVLRY